MSYFKWIIVGDKKGPLLGERKIHLVTLTVRTSIGCSVITGAEASGTILFDPRTPIFGTIGSISRFPWYISGSITDSYDGGGIAKAVSCGATTVVNTGNEDFFQSVRLVLGLLAM